MADDKKKHATPDVAIVLSQRVGDIVLKDVTLKFGETAQLPRAFAEELVKRYPQLKIVK